MFKWMKKKQGSESARSEVTRVVEQTAQRANEAMVKWEASSLELRRQALADSFDERITQIKATPDLPFQEVAEIEALALLKNWIEWRPDVIQEISRYIDRDAWEYLKVMSAAEEYMERLGDRFDHVGRSLADELMASIEEEAVRRGLVE